MKEFRLVNEERNCYGEFDCAVTACKEAAKIGCKVLCMNVRTGKVKEEFSKETIDFLSTYTPEKAIRNPCISTSKKPKLFL